MTAPTVRVPGPLAAGTICLVDGDAARYLQRVRRVNLGASVRLVAEDGTVATARVDALDGHSVTLLVLEIDGALSPPEQRLVLVASGLRSGGTSDLISACAEFGVEAIALTNMQRSVALVHGSKLDRYERVAADACRTVAQPRQTVVEVHESLAEAMDFHPSAALFVMDEEQGTCWDDVVLPDAAEVLLVVGPEGGLEGHERALLRSAGATAVHLRGPAYRARTAALAGTVLFLSRMQRL